MSEKKEDPRGIFLRRNYKKKSTKSPDFSGHMYLPTGEKIHIALWIGNGGKNEMAYLNGRWQTYEELGRAMEKIATTEATKLFNEQIPD